ncbi:hypothetical protein BDV12DRAFT_201975 [Aspergillus spectabilis]
MSQQNIWNDIFSLKWGTDTFGHYLSQINGSVEDVEVASPQLEDEGSNSKVSSSKPGKANPASGTRKRGRPRKTDCHGREVATKEKRKYQIRMAQRAYRSRKEEKLAMLSKRVTELEQKLLIVRGLYLSTHAAIIGSGYPLGCSNNPNLKLLQDNLQLLLANTDVGNPTVGFDFSAKSNHYMPCAEAYPLLLSNMPLSPGMWQMVKPDK